jgi:hypothetical protein
MEFRILGKLEVRDRGRLIELRRRKPRALLAVLLLRSRQFASADELIDALWPADSPPTARAALQNYVSQLRAALGPGVIESGPGEYMLDIVPAQVDVARFEQLVAAGRATQGEERVEKLPADALLSTRGGRRRGTSSSRCGAACSLAPTLKGGREQTSHLRSGFFSSRSAGRHPLSDCHYDAERGQVNSEDSQVVSSPETRPPAGEHRGEHRASIPVTPDTSDPRNHAVSARLRGFRWAVLGSNRIPGLPLCLPPRPNPVKFEATENPHTGVFPNGPAWIRTRDQRIMSPLL